MGYLFPRLRDISEQAVVALTPGQSTNDFSQIGFRRAPDRLYPACTDIRWEEIEAERKGGVYEKDLAAAQGDGRASAAGGSFDGIRVCSNCKNTEGAEDLFQSRFWNMKNVLKDGADSYSVCLNDAPGCETAENCFTSRDLCFTRRRTGRRSMPRPGRASSMRRPR